jgi:hypothetical protein
VYGGDVPALGPSIFLRVASALPAAKGLIVDYGREAVDFAKGARVGWILLVRSVGTPLLCIDAQIADWPVSIREFTLAVDFLSDKPLEDYVSTFEMPRATVVGEFFECLRRLSTLPFGAVFMFVEESVGKKDSDRRSRPDRVRVPPRMD